MASELTSSVVSRITALPAIPDSVAIDNFFREHGDLHCLQWFNKTLSGKGPWKDVSLVDTPQNRLLFHQFWNQSDPIFGGDMTPLQFVCLMSIFANECRCDFLPVAEKMGRKGHPGLAYLFDRIDFFNDKGQKIGSKRSYNTLEGNKTAFDCFNSKAFIEAHGALVMGDKLSRTKDARWKGEEWPADAPTDPTLAAAGFLLQADFMKFRGRGYIQTTGRSNYVALIKFVQAYSGENSTIDFYQHQWSGLTPDQAADVSSNEDWDRLFQQSDMIIAGEAIRLHNKNSKNYLNLAKDAATLNGVGPGSVFFMGKRISGGDQYAQLFKDRVAAALTAVNGLIS